MRGAEVALPIIIGLVVAAVFARMRHRSWRVRGDGIQGNETFRVTLYGGPWEGTTQEVRGNVRSGEVVRGNTFGLVGDGLHHGDYIVAEVDDQARTATAGWQPR